MSTFMELHKAQARVLRALKDLTPEERKRVLDAVLALEGYGAQPAPKA